MATKSILLDNDETLFVDKRGNKKLLTYILDQVKLFYENDDNSRIMSDYKDNKCIKNEDG